MLLQSNLQGRRLVVRTSEFQSGNAGSNPVAPTKLEEENMYLERNVIAKVIKASPPGGLALR